jgi:hypothetical protein
MGNLAVRVEVVGHASPRWRGARNAVEAARLNQALSEARAKNVRVGIEQILKREIPNLPIQVPAKGVGSTQLFPTASEDNAAVDRSVVLTIDLVTTDQSYAARPKPPRRIYTPSRVWTFSVLSMTTTGGIGYVQIFLKIGLRNPFSGKTALFSGWLAGGGGAKSVKDSFKISRDKPSLDQIVGKSINFTVAEPMDFEDWSHGGPGQVEFKGLEARLGKVEVKFGLKTKMTYLVFPWVKTDPDMLIFDSKPFGIGLLGAESYLVYGKLHMVENPGDFLELPSPDDLVPVTTRHSNNDALLISFPTGKSQLSDLSEMERKKLREFTINKARAIDALSKSYQLTSVP